MAQQNLMGMPFPNPNVRPEIPSSFPRMGSVPVEIRERRTGRTREFLNPNGTLSVEVFSQPVHWKNKHGEWVNIDNNIIPAMSSAFTFKNASNDFEIFFTENLNNGPISRIEFEDKFVEFTPLNAQTAVGIPTNNKILYSNVYSLVDFQYIVLSSGLKEEIILADASAPNSFTFVLNVEGVIPRLSSDGTIELIDEENNEVFRLLKPYAFDNKDAITENVQLDLRQAEGEWFVDITLDATWLEDSSRIFPVTIDPSFTFEPKDAEARDTFASSNYPSTLQNTKTFFTVGNNEFYGISRSYLWFNLPGLYSGAKITSAYLELNQLVDDANNNTTINLHAVKTAWNESELTMNNEPTSFSSVLDSKTKNTIGLWSFDASQTVSEWYEADIANLGFSLIAEDETSNRRSFSSEENGDPNQNPKLVINYVVDPTGVEDFWSYVNNVGIHNGNLFLSGVDVHLPGKGVPINVIRSYNSRAGSINSVFGYGWQLNVGMYLKYLDPGNSKVILLVDGDGSKHIFTQRNGLWEEPPGLHLNLKYKAATSTNPAYYVLTDKSQTNYYFDFNTGRFEAIIDDNGNITDLAYNTDGTLANMTDPSGRVINFYYQNGKLVAITGNEIQTVRYAYNTSGDLISVTKENSTGAILEKVSYEYDGYHNIISVTDPKQNKSYVSYYGSDRVYQIAYSVTNANGVLETHYTTYTYTQNIDTFVTEVKDPKNVITRYSTNANGNLVKIEEDYNPSTGNPQRTSSFEWLPKHELKEVIDPRLQKTILNYDENGNLVQLNNAKNQDKIMKYDSKDNLEQVTNFGGETVKSHFDTESNKTAEVNPLSGIEFNEYNDSGDLIKTTTPISTVNNLVINNGFEVWYNSTDLHKWSNGMSTLN